MTTNHTDNLTGQTDEEIAEPVQDRLNDSVTCPFCQSENARGELQYYDKTPHKAWHLASCPDCGAEWTHCWAIDLATMIQRVQKDAANGVVTCPRCESDEVREICKSDEFEYWVRQRWFCDTCRFDWSIDYDKPRLSGYYDDADSWVDVEEAEG